VIRHCPSHQLLLRIFAIPKSDLQWQIVESHDAVSLWPKAFDVLRYLVEHPGRLVTPR
jgi:DNA-binding response OmpR family regulator